MTELERVRVEALKRFFKRDRYVELSGIEIVEITKERVIVQADILPIHLNGNGCVQGGMLYTAADFAFAVLGNYLHPSTVTQSGHISYLRPAYCKHITATAIETERAGHTSVSEVIVRGDNDEVLCICHFNGFIKDMPLETLLQKKDER